MAETKLDIHKHELDRFEMFTTHVRWYCSVPGCDYWTDSAYASLNEQKLKDLEEFFELTVKYELEDFSSVDFVVWIGKMKQLLKKYMPDTFNKYWRD